MPYIARNIVLTTLLAICASSVLASRRHPPSYIEDNKNYHTKIKPVFPEYDTSQWPSNTDDCLRPGAPLYSDTPALYLHDGQFYDKSCLKTLAYLVEPEERTACRTQSDCHYARGYDNECLIQLSLEQCFDFDFEEMRRQELEWKESVCRGKTLDQCGRDHSSWWRSYFPSSRDDCLIHGKAGKRGQGGPGDNWVPWSIGPHGTLYDDDCLSRFANRLGMENSGNCTQTNTYVTHEAHEAPPVELPKTLVYATGPSEIQPHLEVLTDVANLNHLTAMPVTTHIPTPEDSIANIIPTGIPAIQKRKGNGTSPSPVHALTQTVKTLTTPLPLVNRAQRSATDGWSCMWDVNVTLPDSAPGMFDFAFGDSAADETPLVTQRIFKGVLEDLSECSDVIGEEAEESLIG